MQEGICQSQLALHDMHHLTVCMCVIAYLIVAKWAKVCIVIADWWIGLFACFAAVETVRDLCEATLDDGGFQFSCPECGVDVNFTVYRHILSAIKTSDELLRYSQRVTENSLKNQQRTLKMCPTCATYGQRNFARLRNNVNRVVCDTCTRNQGREVPFCWFCGNTWKGSGKGCGNRTCVGTEGDLRVLRSCETKQIGKTDGCPDTRACPKCGQLISHMDKCKHMHCFCFCDFCFVCLQMKDSSGNWQCGGAYEICSVADRQQTLPNYWTDAIGWK